MCGRYQVCVDFGLARNVIVMISSVAGLGQCIGWPVRSRCHRMNSMSTIKQTYDAHTHAGGHTSPNTFLPTLVRSPRM